MRIAVPAQGDMLALHRRRHRGLRGEQRDAFAGAARTLACTMPASPAARRASGEGCEAA
jgi:hypothetical protein